METAIDENEFVKPLFADGMYQNPWTETWTEISMVAAIKFIHKHGMLRPKFPMTQAELDQKIPIVKPNMDILNNPPKEDLIVTWIGHASALVQMEGVNFLTDPVWCERASPISFAGPKRYRNTPIPINELPPISFVVISHDHYDHLDYSVVTALGDKTKWYVPQGLKQWFTKHGVTNVVELSWWEKARFNDDIEIVCTPAQHWSKRYLMSKRQTLWGSWLVLGKHKRVFFSGDTGYCTVFKTIGKHYGPFDLSLIAIGAYCPRDFLKPQHVDPYEALAMHKDLKSKQSVGIHWGTFPLTQEPEDEPPKMLLEAMNKEDHRYLFRLYAMPLRRY